MVEPAHPQKRRLEGEGGAVDGEDMQSRRSEPEIEWEGELRGPQRVIQGVLTPEKKIFPLKCNTIGCHLKKELH